MSFEDFEDSSFENLAQEYSALSVSENNENSGNTQMNQISHEDLKWELPSESEIYVAKLEKKLERARTRGNERMVQTVLKQSALEALDVDPEEQEQIDNEFLVQQLVAEQSVGTATTVTPANEDAELEAPAAEVEPVPTNISQRRFYTVEGMDITQGEGSSSEEESSDSEEDDSDDSDEYEEEGSSKHVSSSSKKPVQKKYSTTSRTSSKRPAQKFKYKAMTTKVQKPVEEDEDEEEYEEEEDDEVFE